MAVVVVVVVVVVVEVAAAAAVVVVVVGTAAAACMDMDTQTIYLHPPWIFGKIKINIIQRIKKEGTTPHVDTINPNLIKFVSIQRPRTLSIKITFFLNSLI